MKGFAMLSIGNTGWVTKDVPNMAVVGGCPAKIIKYRGAL